MVDDTGLVYLFARYYDPELGRFLALDPELGSLSMPQTLNRYLYCVNNPLLFIDPTGMSIFGDIGNWVSDNWKTIAIVAVCVALTVATAGIASPALALAASVAIGAGTSALDYGLNAGSSFSWEGLAMSAAIGGAAGAIGFGAGAAISKLAASSLAKSTAGSIASKLASMGKGTPSNGHFAVIGETMGRVEAYAKMYGGETMRKLSGMSKAEMKAENTKWINKMMDEGYTIIDLGRDPNLVKMGLKTKEFYQLELKEIAARGYKNVKKINDWPSVGPC